MPLSPGTRFGVYEILAPIGAGGMGEVYRARDARLDREVAIKVLPVALARDHDRLVRFEREAKVLASLNHPNIAQIYGFEESGETRALAMELVPGSTLSVPQPLDAALNYAKQIAEALEAAHEKGFTHRDLKPANIMITPDGVVKLLDFGLAAIPSREADGADPNNSPTMTMSATQMGTIMGTAAYMSPEQAAGKVVDRRSDIWSFGVVLYEMLTGARLFEGETVSHTLADVLRAPIDFTKLPSSTPAPIAELVKRCLDRNVKARLQAIGEARIAIDRYRANPAPAAGPATNPPTASGPARFLPWIAASVAIVLAAGLGLGFYRATRPAALKPLVRFDVDLGPDVSLNSLGPDVVLSPDGSRLVYVSNRKLFTRRLDQPNAVELPGAEGAASPFFSPDGQWIAFFTGQKLKKISVEGGATADLCDAVASYGGGSWGEDGNIVATLSITGPLSRIPQDGGTPMHVTELAAGEATHRFPQVLPGAGAVLFTSNADAAEFENANISVLSFKDHSRKTLVRGGTFGRYAATSRGRGQLLYMKSGTLFAAPFDLDALEVRGAAVPVLEQVASSSFGFGRFALAGNGMLLYQKGGAANGNFNVQWLEGDGKTQPLLAKPGAYANPSLSPDGQRLAVEIPDGSKSDLWIYQWQRDTMMRLTFDGFAAGGMHPVWSPDGRYIVFSGKNGIFWTRSDGAGKPERLTTSVNPQVPWSFTPDGKRLAFEEISTGTGYDLWTVPVDTGAAGLRAAQPEVFLQTRSTEHFPAFSPDGRWLAYASDESGIFQVYVRAFPDKGGKWQISSAGGSYPAWSRNGHEVFFRSPDFRIMVAPYAVKGDSLVADQPRVWSSQPILLSNAFSVSPDGKRVAAVIAVTGQALNQVILLENFFDELRREAPLK